MSMLACWPGDAGLWRVKWEAALSACACSEVACERLMAELANEAQARSRLDCEVSVVNFAMLQIRVDIGDAGLRYLPRHSRVRVACRCTSLRSPPGNARLSPPPGTGEAMAR